MSLYLIGLLIVPSTVTPPPPNHYTELSFSWRTQILGRHGFIPAPPYENPLVSIQKNLALVSKNDFIPLIINIPSDFTPTHIFFFKTLLWYPCRYKHRCAVHGDTCLGLWQCWLWLLVKSPKWTSTVVRSRLIKDLSSLGSRLRGLPLRGLFSVHPLFLNLTIMLETVLPRMLSVSAICCNVLPSFFTNTIFYTS